MTSQDSETVIKENPEEMKSDTADNLQEIKQTEAILKKMLKPKRRYSEKARAEKAVQLAKAREIKSQKEDTIKTIEKKVKVIEETLTKEPKPAKDKSVKIAEKTQLIEQIITEKLANKPPKQPKDKTAKTEAKKKMIEEIVTEKLKDYKPKKQLTDFQLIQRFF